jgi:hypothetical protein
VIYLKMAKRYRKTKYSKVVAFRASDVAHSPSATKQTPPLQTLGEADQDIWEDMPELEDEIMAIDAMEPIFDKPALPRKLDDNVPNASTESESTPSPTQTKGLFRLPLEIREKIYAYAMDELPHELILAPGSRRPNEVSPFPAVLPSICFLSRTIYYESLSVFIRLRKFSLCSGLAAYCLFQLLDRLPHDNGFRAVRSIYMSPMARKFRVSDAIRLLSSCTGLQNLVIAVDASDCLTVEGVEECQDTVDFRLRTRLS